MNLIGRPVAILVIAAAFLCVVGGSPVWKVERSLRRSQWDSAGASQVPVGVRILGPQSNPGFEALSAPAVFKSAEEFNSHLYLSGPTGLFVYSLDGLLVRIYRVGPDLPTAPLGSMAVGTLADSRAPEGNLEPLDTVGRQQRDRVAGSHPGLCERGGHPPGCLLYTSPSPRDGLLSRMPSSA